jgi:hypothetical protein
MVAPDSGADPAEVDDASIEDAVVLHRLVPRAQIVEDHDGSCRPSTNAFKKGTRHGRRGRMSVYLDDTLRDQFRTPLEFVDDAITIGSITAGFMRDPCQQIVRRAPTTTDDAHGDVIGPERGSILKRMARQAVCIEGTWADA